MERKRATRLPTLNEAVEIVSMQLSLSSQIKQLRFIEETQGKEFALRVKEKVVSSGGAKNK